MDAGSPRASTIDAFQHLSPRTLAGLTRAQLGIPDAQRPIANWEEKYGKTAKWRIRAVALPESTAKWYWCDNRFIKNGEMQFLREVDWKERSRRRTVWRKSKKDRQFGQLETFLLPPDISARAVTLKEAGHVETWTWAEEFCRRGYKPLPPPSAFLDVSIDELEEWAREPQPIEVLQIQRTRVPHEWLEYAVMRYPNLWAGGVDYDWVDMLDGDTLQDVMTLAKQVSEAVEKRTRTRIRWRGFGSRRATAP